MKLPLDSIKKQVKRTYRQIKKSLSKKKNRGKLLGIAAVVLTLSLGSALLLNNAKDNRQKLQLQSQVEATQKDVEIKGAELKEILEEKARVEQQRIETEQKLHETNRQVEELKKQVQAKREGQARLVSATVAPSPRLTAAPKAATGSGCEWLKGKLASMGVSASDIPAAISIASRESGCRPTARNASSGACNVFQELPCGKWGGLSNTDAHIRGAINYANNRYGGWWGAYNAWNVKHWW